MSERVCKSGILKRNVIYNLIGSVCSNTVDTFETTPVRKICVNRNYVFSGDVSFIILTFMDLFPNRQSHSYLIINYFVVPGIFCLWATCYVGTCNARYIRNALIA